MRADIKAMIYMPVTEPNRWKIDIVQELIDVKWGDTVIEGFDEVQISTIIDELCTS